MKLPLPLNLFLVALFCTAAPLRAGIVINMAESGSDVVATISGSIGSLAGATLDQTSAPAVNFNAFRADDDALFGFSDGTFFSNYNNYFIPIFPSNFGPSSAYFAATSGSASANMFFRETPAQMWIDQNYTLGTPVTGTLTWANQSFATLGVTEGSYLWSWTGDSVTLNIGAGPAPVPEPGTWAAAALLAGGAAFMSWRKRAKVP
jgi:hypothetical protein